WTGMHRRPHRLRSAASPTAGVRLAPARARGNFRGPGVGVAVGRTPRVDEALAARAATPGTRRLQRALRSAARSHSPVRGADLLAPQRRLGPEPGRPVGALARRHAPLAAADAQEFARRTTGPCRGVRPGARPHDRLPGKRELPLLLRLHEFPE